MRFPRPELPRAAAIVAAAAILALLAGCADRHVPEDRDAAANVELYAQQYLDAQWQQISGGGARPAAVATVFFVPYGWDRVIERCMGDAGFASGDASHSTAAVADTGLGGAAGLAWYRCLARYPTYTLHYTELDQAQLDELYAYYSTWLVPCLALHGTGPRDIPSLADFERGDPGRPGGWNPYLTSSRPGSLAAARLLFEQCPPYPGSLLPAP